MNKTLGLLIIVVIVLSWNFVFTDSKKVELTDPAKVLQGLSKSMQYKIAVKDFWKEINALPDAETWEKVGKEINVDLTKSLVKSIEVGIDGPGAITVYFANNVTIPIEKNIDDTKIVLTPEVEGDKLVWSCSGTMYKEYMPKKCKKDMPEGVHIDEN